MRIFPQSKGLGNGKTYNQHIAVQHRNVMLVSNHPKAKQTEDLRVFFPKVLKDRLIQRDGWGIVKEAGAWLGVRPVDAQGFELKELVEKKVKEASRQNTDGLWLQPKSKDSHVVLVLSQEKTHKTIDDFMAYLKTHEYSVNNGKSTYTFVDDLGSETCLGLGGNLPVPHINGKPVNLYPEKVFDSPYLQSVHGSGVVTIKKGDKKQVLDFNITEKMK